MGIHSVEINFFSIKNLNSLRTLGLSIITIDQEIITRVLDQVPYIEKLVLGGNFSNFKLNNLANLRSLYINGHIKENFNVDLFKNLCNQLEVLQVKLINADKKILYKLFDGHYFPNLLSLAFRNCENLDRLEKEFVNRFRFPILRGLFIVKCNLETVEKDSFSNLKNLEIVDLSGNKIKFIEKNTFSYLKHLKLLDLSRNKLTNLDRKFIGVRNSVEICQENKDIETFRRLFVYA